MPGKTGTPAPTTCPSPPPPAEPVSPAFLPLWLLSVFPPLEDGLRAGGAVGISDGRDLCSSLFPRADLCSGGLLELPATLARPGGPLAQPPPRCLLGEEGVDFISQATAFHRDQRGGKAMPQSSAKPASKPASKPAGHPLALPPHPRPITSLMTLVSPLVLEPVSSPAPPNPGMVSGKKEGK